MQPSLGALIGPGRSGTTWAGALLNSNPHVLYRFEPFNRMGKTDRRYREWLDKMKSHRFSQDDIPAITKLLIQSHPLIDKEPFFFKAFTQPMIAKRIAWLAARLAPFFADIYRLCYTPRNAKHLIFKEVTFVKPLQALLRFTSVPIVYLVRHPCATVMSDVTGQLSGKMPSLRQEKLRAILLEHDAVLADRFSAICEGNNVVARTAVLWRCEVETCLREAAQHPGRALVLTYEQLADDAHAGTNSMLQHFGVPLDQQTNHFIEQLYNEERNSASRPRRTGWGDSYFSVMRNPRAQKDAWKGRVDAESRRIIESVVGDSSLIQECARLGAWD